MVCMMAKVTCLECKHEYLIDAMWTCPPGVFNAPYPAHPDKVDVCPQCKSQNYIKRSRHRLIRKAIKETNDKIQSLENRYKGELI